MTAPVVELRRLQVGVAESDRPGGLGTVRFNIWCPANAQEVVARAKEVLGTVVAESQGSWPSLESWWALLPAFFIGSCAPEPTTEDAELAIREFRALPDSEKMAHAAEQPWSLGQWLYWMTPAHRSWWWWDALVLDADHAIVAVEVEEWPFPWAALRWLFLAAGATRFEAEE